jgi:YD repeat-containing protein
MKIALRAVLMMTLVAGAATEAAAHVTVLPKEVPAKGLQEFFIRVPTEKDQPTTSVRIVLPEGFELLRVRPTAGWKYEFERDANDRVTAVTWSGGQIGRTEYEVFTFMARAQNPGTYKLDAYQTYGKSDVVAWINAAEPRPAPQVKVVAAVASAATPAADPFAAPAAVAAPVQHIESAAASSTRSSLVGGAALAMSLAALLLSWQASRRPKS